MSKAAEKAKELAMLTVLSNKISPIQEQNLKMYPFAFFDGVKEVKIKYDLEHKKTTEDEPVINNSLVSYYLTLDNTELTMLEKRFEILEASVRNLFWKDIIVEVYFNNKIVFKSKEYERK